MQKAAPPLSVWCPPFLATVGGPIMEPVGKEASPLDSRSSRGALC